MNLQKRVFFLAKVLKRKAIQFSSDDYLHSPHKSKKLLHDPIATHI